MALRIMKVVDTELKLLKIKPTTATYIGNWSGGFCWMDNIKALERAATR
jgi:hypothetical protein